MEPVWLKSTLDTLKNFRTLSAAPILLCGPDPKALLRLVEVLVGDFLCECPTAGKACEACASCRMYASGNHPDYRWVFPQSLAVEKGLPADLRPNKKPSESIRIEDVRAMQGFFNTASSRGGERFAVLYPFEALNTASANSLLKVLEEPPNGLRFILIGHKAENLLPTIRSRCQQVRAPAPSEWQAVKWLESQGVENPEVVLSLAGLDPFEALDLARNNPDGLELRRKWVLWLASPDQQGQIPAGLEKLGLPALLDLTTRLAFDLSRLCNGLDPVQFAWLKPRLLWAKRLEMNTISDVYAILVQEQRHANHPLNPRLALEFIAQKWQTLSQ